MKLTRGNTVPAAQDVRSGVRALLSAPRYEVLPLAGVAEDAAANLPRGATVTVTASPARGPEATLAVAEELSALGFHAVPHLSAQQFTTVSAVEAVKRLHRAGVDEVFIVGGDSPGEQLRGGGQRDPAAPSGTQSAAVADGEELLTLLRQAFPELSIGVPGYPEGHPHIPRDALDASLQRKLEHADHVVGQLCFDPAAVRRWAEQIRAVEARPSRPAAIYAGVPGAVSSARLLRIASRIGVGDSLRFLKASSATARKLATPLRHDPTQLVTGLIGADGETRLSGLHLYTFNALAQTEQWRRGLLDQLQEGDWQ